MKHSIALLFIIISSSLLAQKSANILVYSKTNGFRHKSIDDGIQALWKMSVKNDWTVSFTEDSTYFTYEHLKNFHTIVFLNTTQDILGPEGESAFVKYMNNGGGFVGIHAATDTEYDWEWYGKMIGAYFKSHPKTQEAVMNVHKDCRHESIAHLDDTWKKVDEWYNFREELPSYVNVLLDMDESSYEGKQMGTYHPISWYHTFEGGRVFYTGLGHTPATFSDTTYLKHLEEGILWASRLKNVPISKDWTSLIDPKLSQWDKYIGVPHSSVELDGVEKSDDIKKGKALGLNNDPLNIFSVDDEGVIKTTGEIYGGLTSKQEYSDYHLKLKYKWGEKKWEPRLEKPRDAGLLYHCTGIHGAFWKVWMRCLELQIQEGETGDLYLLAGTNASTLVLPTDGKKKYKFSKDGTFQAVGAHYGKERTVAALNNELPLGEWNEIELMTIGGTAVHLVNGKVVNVIKDAHLFIDKEKKSLTGGKIQLQSEGATIFYKDIMIKELREFPSEIKRLIIK